MARIDFGAVHHRRCSDWQLVVQPYVATLLPTTLFSVANWHRQCKYCWYANPLSRYPRPLPRSQDRVLRKNNVCSTNRHLQGIVPGRSAIQKSIESRNYWMSMNVYRQGVQHPGHYWSRNSNISKSPLSEKCLQ